VNGGRRLRRYAIPRGVAAVAVTLGLAACGALVGIDDPTLVGGPDGGRADAGRVGDGHTAGQRDGGGVDGGHLDARRDGGSTRDTGAVSPPDAMPDVPCTGSARECSGAQPLVCMSGAWMASGAPCSGQTCLQGACTGVCGAGQVQCDGQQPQACSAEGEWVSMGAPCAGSCTNGACLTQLLTIDASITALTVGPAGIAIVAGSSEVETSSVFGSGLTDIASATNPTITVGSSDVYWTSDADGGSVLYTSIAGGSATGLALGQGKMSGVATLNGQICWSISESHGVGGSSTGQVLCAPTDGMGETFLAQGVTSPLKVAIGPSNVAWIDSTSTLVEGKLGGSGASRMADIGSAASSGFAPTIAGGQVVYAGAPGNVPTQVALDGGALTTLSTSVFVSGGITADDTNVYWTAAGSPMGSVVSVPLGGGPLVTLASMASQPTLIAVDSTSLYWTDDSNTIWKLTPK
jgi:hypothetical protein